MKNLFYKILSLITIFFLDISRVFAQPTSPTTKTLRDLIDDLLGYVNILVSLLFGLIIVVYLWKIVEALAVVDDPKERAERLKGVGVRIFLVFLALSFFTLAQVIYKSFF